MPTIKNTAGFSIELIGMLIIAVQNIICVEKLSTNRLVTNIILAGSQHSMLDIVITNNWVVKTLLSLVFGLDLLTFSCEVL